MPLPNILGSIPVAAPSNSRLPNILGTAPSTAPAKSSGLPNILTPKSTESYWSGSVNGTNFAPSTQLDTSGKPLLDFRGPQDMSTTTDKTRVDTTYNPTVATTTPKSLTQNTRDPSIKNQQSGTERDHIIPLELSGSNQTQNLQNEPLISGTKNTKTDPLENQLADDVASGKMSLFDAQTKIAKTKGTTPPVTGKKDYSTNDGGIFKNDSVLGIIKNTLFGIPKAAWNFLGPGQIQDYLSTPEGQEAAANLNWHDVVKTITPTVASVPLQVVSDISGQDINLKSNFPNIVGDVQVTSLQNITKQAVLNGENPYVAIVKAVPQTIFDGLIIAGFAEKVFSPREAVIATEVKTNDLPSGSELPPTKSFRITAPPKNIKVNPVPNEAIAKLQESGVKLDGYNPDNPTYFRTTPLKNGMIQGEIVQIKPSYFQTFIDIFKGDLSKVPNEDIHTVYTSEKPYSELVKIGSADTAKTQSTPIIPNTPHSVVSTETGPVTLTPSKIITTPTTPTGIDDKTINLNPVRTSSITPQSESVKSLIEQYNATGRVAFDHPRSKTVSLNGGPEIKYKDAITQMKEVLTQSQSVSSLTIKPSVEKPEVFGAAGKGIKINGEMKPVPDQLVTKTQLKDMLKSLGTDSVNLKVIEKDGVKYMDYNKGNTSFKLRPSAVGLNEDNIKVGSTININTQDLKVPGTSLRGVNNEGIVLASGVNPGIDKFIEQDIKPTINKGLGGVTKTWDFIKKVFAPSTRGVEAQQTASILREQLARMARDKEMTYQTLSKAKKTFDKYSEAEALKVIDGIETGHPVPGTEQFSNVMRQTLDTRWSKIQTFKETDAYIENYFPHIWEDPEKAEGVFAKFFGKRPFEGTKSYLKQRTIPTIKEGIALGLKPVSYNPVDLIMARIADMDRFIMAHNSWEQFKDVGLLKFVKFGGEVPDGWRTIDDKIAKVFAPRAVFNKVGEPITMITQTGNWYMPEQAATVINNYLSPGLQNNPIYNAFRMLGNNLNQVQLGMSAYHALFTSGDAVVSKASLELQKVFTKSTTLIGRASALAQFATSPITAPYYLWQNLARGNKLLTDYFKENPQVLELVDALERAGGRVRMDSIYKNNSIDNFLKAARSGNLPGSVIRTPGAMIEAMTKPIMQQLVPRQKLGVFADAAKFIMDQAQKEGWSEYKTTLRLQEMWDSVDNRMGQLVYDNLFWNKVLKDLGMASTRSLGWNLGTIRELGGGLADFAKTPYRAYKGKSRMTPKMAYTLALPFIIGVWGAIIYYLYNHKAPEKLIDYYYPTTGKTKPDGTQERISLPSYMKDVFAYKVEPGQTILNKVHPEISAILQMLQNKDYFGTEIRNPNDPLVKQAEDLAAYQLKQFVPFTVTNMIQRVKDGGSWDAYLQSFAGISPAPGYITRTPLQTEIYNLYDLRFGGGVKSQESAAVTKQKSDIKNAYYAGDSVKANQLLQQAVADGVIKANGVKQFITEADIPNDVKLFTQLPSSDQDALIKNMNLLDLSRYAWYVKTDVKAHFSTLSDNTKAFVSMVKSGDVKKPVWKKQMQVKQ